MIKSIRHLRGSEAEWAANDIVIPDGEIAILKTASGSVKLKVGNGSSRFSDLPALIGNTVKPDTETIEIKNGVTYRLGTVHSLNLIFPSEPDDDFYTEISFTTDSYPPDFAISEPITFTGDGTADGDFLADKKRHYTVFIWYDGEYQGVIRGVPYA